MSFTQKNHCDNYITNKIEWERIKDYIPKNKKIYAPFYCDGKQKEYFKEMGFDIIHEDTDFFTNTFDYDIIVDNPPFGNLRPILERLKKINKPFILIMPSSKINAVWFQNLFSDALQLIIPKKKLHFSHLDGKTPFKFNWGCYFYCYKMNLDKDLIFID